MKIFIPHIELESPNIKKHWTKSYTQNKKKIWIIKCHLNKQERPELPTKVVMTRVAPTMADFDNLVASMKEIIDGVADWLIPGLAPGRADGDPRISWEYCQRKGGVREYGIELEFIHLSKQYLIEQARKAILENQAFIEEMTREAK